MKQFDIHQEAVKYARTHIVPEDESEECETIDLVKHLELFATQMIERSRAKAVHKVNFDDSFNFK